MSLDSILNHFSLEQAWGHLLWLNENAPVRISGSGGDRHAAEYFAACFADYGLDTYLDTFTTYRSIPQRGTLQVLSPSIEEMSCEACGHIASTPDSGIDAELVDVGFGDVDDYRGKDVQGCVVLTDITSGPPRPEKARIAVDHGAAGIVFSNLGPPEHRNIPMGAIKSVWGNPTRASFGEIPQIPAVGITRADGDTLRRYCAQSKTHIRMVAQASRDWGPLSQPWARLKAGRNPSGDVLVIGGHFDAWEPGMSDNATGNALILELARVFNEHRDHLRRDVVFAMWNGHEIGEIAGSTWFVDTNWDELDEHGVAYFNVDTGCYAGSSYFETASNPQLVRFHQAVEQRISGAPAHLKRLTRANEQPFFPIGIPALEGGFRFSDEQIAAWDNAGGGWWWHSTADTLDKADQTRFHQTFDIYAGYIWEMCTSPVLPMDYVAVAHDLGDRIDQVERTANGVVPMDLPIDAFSEAAHRLNTHIEMIRESDEHTIQQVNRTLKRLSRILMPAFETYGGRYAQDRVAHPALKSPIPALHDLQTCLNGPPDSDLHHLLSTELLRARNYLSDALRRATVEIETVL